MTYTASCQGLFTARELQCDMIRDASLTCARKPTRVSLIYRTEPITRWKTEKKTKKEKNEVSVNTEA